MKSLKGFLAAALGAAALLFGSVASADSVSVNTVGAGGYDLVSYQNGKKPIPGNGHFTATVNGVTYLFDNKSNLKTFNKNPDKYLPQYGGYCAFGAAVGKKFAGDPTVWEVVDGKLYLNLDNRIKADWSKDIPGYIAKADKNWKKIKNVPASEL
ncbi:YHS domain protein [bacterium SCSIO 12696]|nr:YHS domain protein [bacterium SCSIO 12696]